MAQIAQYLGTGKRKTSVARVILRPGDGADVVQRPDDRGVLPARDAPRDRCWLRSRWPGSRAPTTSASACTAAGRAARPARVRHGIARALVEADPNLRSRSSARAS